MGSIQGVELSVSKILKDENTSKLSCGLPVNVDNWCIFNGKTQSIYKVSLKREDEL